MFYPFIMVFLITTINSMNCMDHVKTSKKNRISLPFGSSKNQSLSHDGIGNSVKTPAIETTSKGRKRSSSLPPVREIEEAEHGFISATRTLNVSLIQFYLSGNSFNPNRFRDNKCGNTVLHIIAGKKNKLNSSIDAKLIEPNKIATLIMNIFLEDYRTDFSMLNRAGSTPRDLLGKKEDSDDINWRRRFFARCSLNTLVNQFAMKIKNYYQYGSISQQVIEATIQQIIDKSIAIEQAQEEDRVLPAESRLPAYATKNFIQQMLLFRLESITNN